MKQTAATVINFEEFKRQKEIVEQSGVIDNRITTLNDFTNNNYTVDKKLELLNDIVNKASILLEHEINNSIHEEKSVKSDVLNTNELDILLEKDLKYINMEKEYEMKINRIRSLNQVHIEFLLVSFITIILSLVGIIVFSVSGFYIIHPSIYMLLFIMGIGWGATAIASVIKNRR